MTRSGTLQKSRHLHGLGRLAEAPSRRAGFVPDPSHPGQLSEVELIAAYGGAVMSDDDPMVTITRDHWRVTGVLLGDIPLTRYVSRIVVTMDPNEGQTVDMTLRLRATIKDRDTDGIDGEDLA